MIVADTSVWIDLFRGIDSPQHRALRKLIEEEEDVSITEIIIAEILQGIRQDSDFQKVKEYLLEFPVQKPEGTSTYVRAAQVYRECRKKGKTPRKTVDCIIAAICIENDLALLHNDRDFDAIEAYAGLKVLRT
ncbi:MAG: PIN domain nuclease [Chloroflexota bacterium]|nr:MAG: PIN domain nuclease [Chloroflexota bacterium]